MMPKILMCLFVITLWACGNSTSGKKDSRHLKLKLQPTSYLGIGYGEVYPCVVLEVLKGDFSTDSLLLTILAGDTLNSNKLASAKEALVISFQKHKEGAPYRMMPISGMVDPEKTSWLITKIETAKN